MATQKPHTMIWSPHEGRSQFAIGGVDLRLYDYLGEDEDGRARTSQVAINTDLTIMKCFDWSSHPNVTDLMAVGLSGGKSCVLIRLTPHSPDDNIYPTFHFRVARTCNAVAFSRLEPNLLASGMEKVRNENCLMIWDVERAREKKDGNGGATGHPLVLTPTVTSLSGLKNMSTRSDKSTNEFDGNTSGLGTLNTLDRTRFGLTAIDAPSQPRTAAPSIHQVPVPVPDDPIQSYSTGEPLTSIAWFPNHPSQLVVGAPKCVRVYDIRENISTPSAQSNVTRGNLGVATDPLHHYRFASHTEDGLAYIWDTRKPNTPILSLRAATNISLTKLSFSPFRSGLLATHVKDSKVVKIWDIREGPPKKKEGVANTAKESKDQRDLVEKAGTLSTVATGTIDMVREGSSYGFQTLEEEEIPGHGLWRTRKTSPLSDNLLLFTWIPTLKQSHHSSASYQILTHTRLGDQKTPTLKTLTLHEPSSLSFCPVNSLALGHGSRVECTGPDAGLSSESEPSQTTPQHRRPSIDSRFPQTTNLEPPRLKVSMSAVSRRSSTAHRHQDGIEDLMMKRRNTWPEEEALYIKHVEEEVTRTLEDDISVTMRKRAELKYGMDFEQNRVITDENERRDLKEVWEWLIRSEALSNELQAQIGNIDYSFQGVHTVWFGFQSLSSNKRNSPMSTPKTTSPPFLNQNPRSERLIAPAPAPHIAEDSEINFAVISSETSFMMPNTQRPAQRRLALRMCGFGTTQKDVEAQLAELESQSLYERAAALALFCGLVDRAVKLLSRSRDERRKLMSAALAGYAHHNGNSEERELWRDLCLQLADDLRREPYLRVMFAYVAKGNWSVVLQDEDIALRERIAVAVRVLEDNELTEYLRDLTQRSVAEGNIEAIHLTGISRDGVELFSKYVNRTGDVQTASLVLSVLIPARFEDARVTEWVDSYRFLLDRWKLFYERARFDVARGSYAKKYPGASVDIAPSQIYVRCNKCNQSVSHNLVIHPLKRRDGRRVAPNVPTSGGSTNLKQKSIVCASCKKPLPRCALCQLYMGTPTDSMRESIVANRLPISQGELRGFNLWFAWCNTCKHGGHAGHISEWFERHNVCPVSGCDCQCEI